MKRLYLAAALAAGVSLGASGCGVSLQSLPKIGGQSGPTYTVTATFANVVNLPDNAQVRVGASTVGDVSSIGLHDFRAVLHLKIKKGVRLPVGTTASIRFDTPLGDDFVELQPPSGEGGGPFLAGGSSIPGSETTTAPSVEDTFAALGALLNGGGIDQLQTIVHQTDLALSGNQQDIRSLLQNLDSTVSTLAHGTPALDDALTAMATLSKTLNEGSSTITEGIAALGPAASVLAGETTAIDSLTDQLDKLGTAASAIVDASAAGTVETVDALDPLLTQLIAVKGRIGPALSAITALEEYTPRAVPGDYLQLSVNATIGLPPVPSDALPLQKVTVDPPDPLQAYSSSSNGAAVLIEGGLP